MTASRQAEQPLAITALEACRVRVCDVAGCTVFDRPMVAGQSVPFEGCGQIFLMSARQPAGAYQQLKFRVD